MQQLDRLHNLLFDDPRFLMAHLSNEFNIRKIPYQSISSYKLTKPDNTVILDVDHELYLGSFSVYYYYDSKNPNVDRFLNDFCKNGYQISSEKKDDSYLKIYRYIAYSAEDAATFILCCLFHEIN